MRLETTAADTLTQSLRPAAVDVSRLGREYMPLLQLVRLLIGVVPNCDSYLAIFSVSKISCFKNFAVH